MTNKIMRRVLVAASLLPLCAGGGRAATYVVATTGNDANAGSAASPFRTVQRGVNAASAGDTIVVENGTYPLCTGGTPGSGDGIVLNKSGAPGSPITLMARNPGQAILDGQLICHANMAIGSVGWWRIIGFDFIRGYWSGMFSISRGYNIVVQRNRFYNIGNRYNNNNWAITGAIFGSGSANITIDRNVFRDIGPTSAGSGDNAMDHEVYIQGTGHIITNNLFYRSLNGPHLEIGTAGGGANGFTGLIANNTFHGPPLAANSYYIDGVIYFYGSNFHPIIENNIFYNVRRWAMAGDQIVSGSCSIRNNLVYNPPGTPYAGAAGLITVNPSGCTPTGNLMNVDPKMVAPGAATPDYHLTAGSPAIGAGRSLPQVPFDFDGAIRPQGGTYDIGAFEYGGTTPPPTVDTAPPVISGVAASAVSQSGATIAWTTNEAADAQVEYGPTVAYGSSSPLNAAFSLSHGVALSGLMPAAVYHYRVRSKDAAGNAAASPDATFMTAASAPAGCVTSAAAWQNAPFASQSGAFTVSFDAVPGAANMDGVSGLSNGSASDYSSLAAAVRFNNAGTIDARNGAAYGAAASIPYVGGLTYRFRLVVDVRARAYSAYVKQGSGAEQMIGGPFAFRAEQAGAASLSNMGLFASTGSEQVCAVAVSAGTIDSTAPAISSVSASAIGQNGATIGWSTNEAGDTQVEYGPTTAYGTMTPLTAALSLSHAAALSGLSAGRLYHYRVRSKDAAGNLGLSANFTFTTASAADTAAPVVSAVAASGVSQTGASIGWTTNEPSDTQVEYGPTTAYGASTLLNSALVTSHGAALSGLSAGTVYRYRVKSKDAAGNLATSPDATFTTAAGVPAPGCVSSAGSWKNAAMASQTGTFTAEFDAVPGAASIDGVNGLSNGAAADYTALAAVVRFNNAGRIDARNGGAYAAAASIPYVAGMTYRFRLVVNMTSRTYSAYVKPGSGSEQLIGASYAFRAEQASAATLNNVGFLSSVGSQQVCAVTVTGGAAPDSAPPVILGVAASAVSQSGATIGWTTNEASDTQVEYGPTAAYGASTLLNPAMTVSHGAAVSGLAAGTLYYYRVKSKDAAGNLGTSPGATFTTAAAPAASCVNSAGSWANAPLPVQSGTFIVEFDATPAAARVDAVMGLSNGPAGDYAQLAAIVRFNTAGTIDARNAGAYTAAEAIPYVSGLAYRFRLEVNLTARKYSAYVRQGANADRLIGAGYAFRAEQSGLTAIRNLGLLVSSGSAKICGLTVR